MLSVAVVFVFVFVFVVVWLKGKADTSVCICVCMCVHVHMHVCVCAFVCMYLRCAACHVHEVCDLRQDVGDVMGHRRLVRDVQLLVAFIEAVLSPREIPPTGLAPFHRRHAEVNHLRRKEWVSRVRGVQWGWRLRSNVVF